MDISIITYTTYYTIANRGACSAVDIFNGHQMVANWSPIGRQVVAKWSSSGHLVVLHTGLNTAVHTGLNAQKL